MSIEANKAILRRYVEQLNQRNESVIDELIAEDFAGQTLHADPAGSAESPRGPAAVREGYRRNVTAFPDYSVTIEDLIAEDDRVVMHWTHRGTHSANFLGVPATGKEIRGAAVSIYRIAGGQIAEVRALWDSAEVWQQLGLIPDTESILAGVWAEADTDT
jgi:steroid delta-isomerase-like uncharacterized protein